MGRRFVHRSRIEAPAEAVFAWHARDGAFERLAPPWEDVAVVERAGGLLDRGRVRLRIRKGPLAIDWLAQHGPAEPGRFFTDSQLRGPFARWEHRHTMEPFGPGASILEDAVEYALPLGRPAEWLAGGAVDARLRAMFGYRHRVTAADLADHAGCPAGLARVVVSGASGLIGSALAPFLTAGGHEVVQLRRGAGPGPRWDPPAGRVDGAAFAGAQAVVHLAGENVAAGRWTAARKRRLRASRVDATRLLAEALARLPQPPGVLVCASAIGGYGERGDQPLTEASPLGRGFLADLSRDWEAAAEPARAAGIRVVQLRFGIVLTPRGGALARMLPPFRLGAGGPLGSGRQWFSWVAVDDVLRAVHHALRDPSLRGPVNVTAPGAVTHAELARTLARVLRRPALARVPAWAARALFGEMAEALLLASTRVVPERLEQAGFRFLYPDLEGALRHLLGRLP